jgi:predicted RNA-binding Zn-ribbon protein involved in translation (DUF1610 family)
MKCPACDSDRVYRSRAKTLRDQALKRLLPVTFYRCHECGWRKPRWQQLSLKSVSLHTLSLVGYIGSIGLVAAVILSAVALTLKFLGVPMPWTR